ncbi:MAG: 50S ribosomal protein L15 [Flammeovirgaceae bacterium]|nr:50S ribosomal protein L15 [Flammeovirgaceae bacterium]MDW8288763.1 50S ribosomal protein L15 [Flammeovirgaceae bacterium]
MELHNLKPAKGAVRPNKRLGRGQGSGMGGTSTRGHKGAKSRSGYHRKIGFEGGQMPMQRRVPKFGFKNPFRVEYTPLNVDRLQKISQKHNITSFDTETFVKLGIIARRQKVKILGKGDLSLALQVKAHAFSASAKEKIEKAGGSAIVA